MYENAGKWEEYAKTLEKLARLHAAAYVCSSAITDVLVLRNGPRNDAPKCAEAVQKLIELRRDESKSNHVQVGRKILVWSNHW